MCTEKRILEKEENKKSIKKRESAAEEGRRRQKGSEREKVSDYREKEKDLFV